jgi:hypothetical protein
MLLQRLALNFSSSPSRPDKRHCYVSDAQLEQLLAAPETLELLLLELTGRTTPLPMAEQLASIRQSAIHLSVTSSAFTGMSVEELIVACAYASPRFEHSPWKRDVARQLSAPELARGSLQWLEQRAESITDGRLLGKRRWPLVGATERGPDWRLLLAVSPIATAAQLEAELLQTAAEADFAHEHYLACSPATALSYLYLQARSGPSLRWDAFALDRKLRSLGLGLLLAEQEGMLLYLPARYHAVPLAPPLSLGL